MQPAYSITCDEFIDRASDYIDEQMGPASAMAMQMHLAGCISCARYHRVLTHGLRLAQEAPAVEPSPDFAVRLHMRLRAVDDEMLANQRAVTSGVAVVLAVATLVALAAWGPLLTQQFAAGDRVAGGAATESASSVPSDGLPLDLAPLQPAAPTASWDWLAGPTSFSGAALRPVHVPATFPGPYSPLVIQPPDVGTATLTAFPGNE